jgi:hypothetical protein
LRQWPVPSTVSLTVVNAAPVTGVLACDVFAGSKNVALMANKVERTIARAIPSTDRRRSQDKRYLVFIFEFLTYNW